MPAYSGDGVKYLNALAERPVGEYLHPIHLAKLHRRVICIWGKSGKGHQTPLLSY